MTEGVKGAELSGSGGLLSDIIETNPLLAVKSLGVEMIDTPNNPNGQLESEATILQTIEVTDGDGGFIDHGECPAFWTYLRRQVAEQTDAENPWLVGHIVKGRRAYRLEPPTPAELEAASRAIGLYLAQTADNGAEPEGDDSEE